ncbi:MFS transporter [Actinomyces sp. HMSC06A08]|nr:MFS transporter [Actinomyces sp. HMSC064C12]OFK01696.1 MFS transporter [Actinomyces sp. HMSC072A03]OFT54757.1 MFS transporter [Actinomyces sp. HMSC06A08]
MQNIDFNSPAHRQHARRKINIVTLAITMGALAFGYDTGVISGALPFLTNPISKGGLGLTPFTEGLVTASLLLGAAFGAILTGRFSDAYGRRRSTQVLALVFFVGALGTALAPNVVVMVVFRIILGFGVGGASATIPMFIAELAPSHVRGQLVSRNELMIVTGQLLAYTSNAAIGQWGNEANAWRWMLALCAIPAALLFIGVLFVPESPRWLIRNGRLQDAWHVLADLRTEDPQAEIKEIDALVQRDAREKGTIKDLATPWIRRITLIGIGFGIVIQLTGVNAIMYFAPTVLISTGLGTQASLVATIANGAVSVASVAFGLWLLGYMNRRKMLMIGMSGIVISQILLGTAFLVLPQSWARSIIILVLMLAFLFFMQAFCAVCFWLMMAEIFPLKVRGIAMGVAVFCQWISNMIVTFMFPILLDALGGKTFYIFAAINVLSLLFQWKYLPETRDKTLEELEREFAAGKSGKEPAPAKPTKTLPAAEG